MQLTLANHLQTMTPFCQLDAPTYTSLRLGARLAAFFNVNSPGSDKYLVQISESSLLFTTTNSMPLHQHYKIDLESFRTYRLIRPIQNRKYTDHWHLEFQLQNSKILLFSQAGSKFETWDRQFSRKVNKNGFHEEFKPVRLLAKNSKVYRVKRFSDGKDFAVKAFSKKTLNSNPRMHDGLISQIKLMRLFSAQPHENILPLHSVYESQNSLYLVMQFCKGGTLLDKIQSTPRNLDQKHLKYIINQILSGLAHLHSKNIVHRDIKPENILFKNKDSFDIVIADLGLATVIDADQYLFTRCGTPGYVAPEIFRAKPNEKLFNTHCDIFSLGAIFHLLLTGTQLFQGQNPEQMLERNKNMDFKIQLQKCESKNKNALSLLQKMLECDPYQRISAEQALKDPWLAEKQKEEVHSLIPTQDFGNYMIFQQQMDVEQIESPPSRDKKKEYRKASHF